MTSRASIKLCLWEGTVLNLAKEAFDPQVGLDGQGM
jgi:hypothetical protein